MSTFDQRLQGFLERQRGQSPATVQNAADRLSRELQEYAPRERWGNVFKQIVAIALGIGLGHALAAALVRGADGLMADTDMNTESFASAIEDGNFDHDTFVAFMEQEMDVYDVPLDELDGFDVDAAAGDVDMAADTDMDVSEAAGEGAEFSDVSDAGIGDAVDSLLGS